MTMPDAACAPAPAAPPDRAALKALAAPSDRKGLRQLAGHLGLLALTAALVVWSRGSVWLVSALLGHGIVLVFLFAPLHEAIHRTAFRRRRLNDAVARLCGGLLLLPAGYFRAFHLQHHRFTQDPARDPELSGRPLGSRGAYLLHLSGLPYWVERVATTCRHALGRVPEDFIAARQRPAIVREARGHLAVYAALAGGSLAVGTDLLLWLWVIPALLGQPALRLFLLAEHAGCPAVADMLANSRTTPTNAAVAALSWNMNRHTAHHAYPAVPFHALPAADRLLAPRTALRADGYRAVHGEIWASLAKT
jgi:fatty acid desaturase